MKSRRVLPFPGGARLFQRMYTRLRCGGRPPHFVTEYFPYASLTHTIRLRDETAYVRLSDLLRTAPRVVQEAAAALLLARIYRRPVPRDLAAVYREYSLAHHTRQRVMRVRGARARRTPLTPRGEHFNLAPLFDKLNLRYFGGALPQPRLGWSRRAWRSQLGCFDPALEQIVLSRRLDRANVPEFAIEYVLFHEMLHVKHPMRRASCGLQSHSAHFRAEEKRFDDYARARRFLEQLV